MNAQTTAQPPSRKFVVGLGAIMAAFVIYWGGFFSDAVLRDGIPLLVFVAGLFLIAPKVGAFLSWLVQKKG